MGATPRYALPYPESADPANVPLDMNELATGVETSLGTVDDYAHTEVASLDTRVDALEAGSALAVIDAAGDLIVGTGPDAATRLPVAATAGQILTSDPAQAGKMRWAAAAGILRGRINTAGPAILQGTGFTFSRTGAGQGTITFTAAFAAPAMVVGSMSDGQTNRTLTFGVPTVSSVVVTIIDPTIPNVVDGVFTFLAMAP